MDLLELIEKYRPFTKQYLLPLSLGLFGLMFLVYGLISLSLSKNEQNAIIFESDKESLEKIIIDVEGGVISPGIYTLPKDARVHDALVAAKGLSDKAQREWVSKNINLAMPLTDGAKIYIPLKGEEVLSSKVNINNGSKEQLDSLSGIGEATAEKIISSRPYSTILELVSKKIISTKVFEKIKDKITVY